MNRRIALILAGMTLCASGSSFGQSEVPNVFESGQPAKAAEVNENFDALQSAIDVNSVRLPPVVKDGNGNEIGQLISIGENGWDLVLINQSGYIQSVGFEDGDISSLTLVYESPDCSGTPYALDTFGGKVETYVDASGIPTIYYVPKSAIPITDFVSNSLAFDGFCYDQGGGGTAWPVLVNDPTVTGVASTTYTLPLRIDRADGQD